MLLHLALSRAVADVLTVEAFGFFLKGNCYEYVLLVQRIKTPIVYN